MGETGNPHFYDFGISGRVPGSQIQLILSSETPGYLKQSETIPGAFQKYSFCKLHFWHIWHFYFFPKRRGPTNPDDPFNKILKISYMRSVSIEKHEMEVWKYGILESLKSWNFGFLKPGSQSSLKLQNQEANKPRNCETKKPTIKKPRDFFIFK